jgi:hypothetical protein
MLSYAIYSGALPSSRVQGNRNRSGHQQRALQYFSLCCSPTSRQYAACARYYCSATNTDFVPTSSYLPGRKSPLSTYTLLLADGSCGQHGVYEIPRVPPTNRLNKHSEA